MLSKYKKSSQYDCLWTFCWAQMQMVRRRRRGGSGAAWGSDSILNCIFGIPGSWIKQLHFPKMKKTIWLFVNLLLLANANGKKKKKRGQWGSLGEWQTLSTVENHNKPLSCWTKLRFGQLWNCFEWNVARIANDIQCNSLLSGLYCCHDLLFTTVKNVNKTEICPMMR